MKTSDYIADFLFQKGVTHVFEVCGGMIAHLLDSIRRQGKIQLVSMHHEQSAAFAADAVGRITGRPGVAMATSGPGATNLMTGIGSAYFDSSPTVFITGQVNRYELKGDRPIRQLGFQEADIVSMAKPIMKAAWQVGHPEEIPSLLGRAFQMAAHGRPGPVLLDIPMDIQRAEISEQPPPSSSPPSDAKDSVIEEGFWEELFESYERAKRPLLLVGGGIRAARATELLRTFVQKIQIPVVQSLMGISTFPSGNPLYVGMIGSYGNRWTNLTLGRSDFLLVLGSRLDIRQTGSEVKAFKGDRMIFHVDCEAGEMNNRVKGCREIISDLKGFLEKVIQRVKGRDFPQRSEWLREINELRNNWPDTEESREIKGINPNRLMHQLSRVSKKCAAYAVDVGQHQMWAAQSLEIEPYQQFLTSGGMGSMGFALPAAVGAAFVSPSRPVVVIAGDGGFQHNLQELQTVVHHQLPLKIVVLNNGCHGMVRQFQQSYFEGQYTSTLWGYSAPNFERVAEAYGVAAKTVEKENELEGALRWFWESDQKPMLLQVMIDTYTNVYPKIAFGKPITEMEPLSLPVELEGA